MSSPSTTSLVSASKLPRNLALLEAGTGLHADPVCGYLVEKLNEITGRLSGEKHTVVRVFRSAGTESPESCLDHLFLAPRFYRYSASTPECLGNLGLVGTAVYYFPGSSTNWLVDPQLHALVDPVFRLEEPFGQERLESERLWAAAGIRELEWEEHEEAEREESAVSDWDVDARLQPPPIRFRRMRTRLRFIGREAARIAYDPDRD